MEDTRSSRLLGNTPCLQSTASLPHPNSNTKIPSIPHVINSTSSRYGNPPIPAPRSYSTPPLSRSPNQRQRWSTVPTSTSSLSIVETIDYSTIDCDSPSEERDNTINKINDMTAEIATLISKREKSKAHFRGIMRGLFIWRAKEMSMTQATTKPKSKAAKVKDASKRDSSFLKKEGAWNRLSIIIRPPKPVQEQEEEDFEFQVPEKITPMRVDSGVDIRSTRSQDFSIQRQQQKRTSNASSTSSATLSSLRSSSVPAPNSRTAQVYSAPPKPLNLTPKQKAHLLSQLRLIRTLLEKQTVATEGFSNNIAGLLWEKHHSLEANKHLNKKLKIEMTATLKRVREQTAGMFMKKGTYLDRSLASVASIIALLELLEDENARPRSPSLDSLSTASSITLSPRHELTTFTLQSLIQTLKTDLSAHSHLDPALRNTVVLPTQDTRFPASGNERLGMKRFVRFVDGRIRSLAAGYWTLGRLVREVEGWVDEFEE